MRISRHPFPVTIVRDQKQLENVECFKYFVSMLTDDGRCTCEIIKDCRGKSCIQQEVDSFYRQIGLKFEEETNKMLHLKLCMVLKIGHSGQQIRNTWKVLKCGAGEGWRRLRKAFRK